MNAVQTLRCERLIGTQPDLANCSRRLKEVRVQRSVPIVGKGQRAGVRQLIQRLFESAVRQRRKRQE